MAKKRLLYFTAQQVSVYSWKSGDLLLEHVFPSGEEGAAAFGEYVSVRQEDLYYILADLVEEDFSQENIPAVRGADRRALITRKIAQRYRDITLAMALSLGTETAGGRREERLLFSSFTNTQQFQPWLAVLRSRQARLVGVFSLPLIAPLLGKRAGFKGQNFLLVSQAQAGMRQSYVENGQIRFSRLGNTERGDPRAAAQICASESARIQQYLINLRIIARDAGTLDVLVLAPGQYKSLYDAACQSSTTLKFHVLDLEQTSRAAGLKTAPEDAQAEALFMHVLATSQPAQQFAVDDLRRFYHIWRARIALLAAGAGVFAFCVLFSLLRMVDVYNTRQQAELDRQQETQASQQYARMQLTFPKTPTPSDKLKVIVQNYQTLLGQTTSPEPLLSQISAALAGSPQIELERINWSLGPGARPGEAPKSPAAAKAPSAVKPAAAQAGGAGLQQTAELSGRINIGQSSDYRAITRAVDQFVDGLRKQAGIEVLSRRLPFDITAEKSLSGDIGAQRAAEVPRFTIVLSRRVES